MIALAQTCRCGLAMRTSHTTDAWECRCGMVLYAQPVYSARHANRPIPDDAWEQREPWKEPDPGVRASNEFADIGPLAWEWTGLDPSRVDKAAWQRMCADAFERSGIRYVQSVKPPSGRTLILQSGETLLRDRMYGLAPLGREVEAMRDMVQGIRGMHGPGKLWAHGDAPINPMVNHATGEIRVAEIGGVMHIVMSGYYFHQPDGAK